MRAQPTRSSPSALREPLTLARHAPEAVRSAPRKDAGGTPMKRVTGIGGVFFHAKDPATLGAWYKTHLGIDVQNWGGAVFEWAGANGNPIKGSTAWLIAPADGDQFAPSKSPFMI